MGQAVNLELKPRGIIPALCTFTDSRGNLDEQAERALVRTNLAWGASALAPSIVAGEFYKFSDAERKSLFEVVVEEARGKVPVWAGISHLGTEPAVELGRAAKDAGASGVIGQASLVGREAPLALREHFATILEKVDLPLMIQDAEDFNGVKMHPSLYSSLADEYSHFVSVKIEGGDTLGKIRDAKAELGDRLSILGGMGGRLMLEELPLGTAGSIPNSCMTDLLVQAFEYGTKGKTEQASQVFARYKPWLDFVGRHPASAFEIVKATLISRGVPGSPHVRSPRVTLGEEARAELRALLGSMDLPRAP